MLNKTFVLRPERGTALIVAMAIVLLLASLSSVLMNEMMSRSTRVEVQQEDMLAFEAAEAGIDAAINDINQSKTILLVDRNGKQVVTDTGIPLRVYDPAFKPGCLGTKNWNPGTDDILPGGIRPPGYIPRPTWKTVATKATTGAEIFNEPNITPQILGDVAFFTYAVDWLTDNVDNDGKNGKDIDDVSERNMFTIYSTGIHRGMLKAGVTEAGRIISIQVIVQAKDKNFPQLDVLGLENQPKPRNEP
jgi:hypothetical protein